MNNERNIPSISVQGIGLVDKQNGGNGQYARVEVSVVPLMDSEAANTVTNAVVGASIPTNFIPRVIAGVNEGLVHGPAHGYPVTGIAVTITGGKAHAVDSSPQAFQEAGRLAVQDALRKAEPALLEPIAQLDVTTPQDYLGAIIGDINRRRGQVQEMNTLADGTQTVRATVPLAETFGYATDLRSLTQGRASFLLEPKGYAEVSPTAANRATT